ncbi:hypothetical protein [Almyronema epifaneia]|uniref:Uncharacterized protein n=1 Tax=Almyronema epifaneia S1 TaxID=2991925 RepID=A0ABW6IBD3_9CYAN
MTATRVFNGVMMTIARTPIRLNRLFLAILITFLVADTYPHPHLSSGVIASTWHYLQSALHQDSAS